RRELGARLREVLAHPGRADVAEGPVAEHVRTFAVGDSVEAEVLSLQIRHVGLVADPAPETVVIGGERVDHPDLTGAEHALGPRALPWADLESDRFGSDVGTDARL